MRLSKRNIFIHSFIILRLNFCLNVQIAESYYGLVIENFKCEQSIYTAVEVTAGNRLFHHIVESDKVKML